MNSNHHSSSTLTIPQALQLAQQYHRAGNLPQAEVIYRQILQANPHHADALHLLGVIAAQTEQYEQAILLFKQAISLNNNNHIYYGNLGNALQRVNQLEEAIYCLQRAIALQPKYAEAHDNLGKIYRTQGKVEAAVACFRRALAIKPNYVEAHNNLGNALRDLGQLTAARQAYQRALAINPHRDVVHNNLANIWRDQGKIQQAITSYRQALKFNPHYPDAHSNLLYSLNCTLAYDAATIFLEHCQFYQQHAQIFATTIKPHRHNNNPQRPLNIGYLSPDFRQHSVAYFVEAILAHHDQQAFKIFAYHNHPINDEITLRLQRYVNQWVNCTALTDDTLAEKIRQDNIDILIDLTGHTAYNRLLVFARKPAPIQISYLGYPNTTGLPTIDYRLTDHLVEPPGSSEAFSTETLLRMHNSYFCYHPPENSPPINELPALTRDHITFGSFNNYHKLTEQIKTLWAKILHAIPHAQLVVKAKSLDDSATWKEFLKTFTQQGIAPQRVKRLAYAPTTQAHLTNYHQIDLALDTYPYNGATTTCEALWMGVPTITLVGTTHASRMGLSILTTVALTELITYREEDYLNTCCQLAQRLDYLQQLRQTMRARLQTSPLMDGMTFTRNLEDIFRQVWKNLNQMEKIAE